MREVLWSFETSNYKVVCCAEPEEQDPADSFESEDDIKAVRNGDLDWFCASVRVYFRGELIGVDHLGGCAYEDAHDFVTEHRNPDPMARNCSVFKAAKPGTVICTYFPAMVREAVAEAREHIRAVKAAYIRGS